MCRNGIENVWYNFIGWKIHSHTNFTHIQMRGCIIFHMHFVWIIPTNELSSMKLFLSCTSIMLYAIFVAHKSIMSALFMHTIWLKGINFYIKGTLMTDKYVIFFRLAFSILQYKAFKRVNEVPKYIENQNLVSTTYMWNSCLFLFCLYCLPENRTFSLGSGKNGSPIISFGFSIYKNANIEKRIK